MHTKDQTVDCYYLRNNMKARTPELPKRNIRTANLSYPHQCIPTLGNLVHSKQTRTSSR